MAICNYCKKDFVGLEIPNDPVTAAFMETVNHYCSNECLENEMIRIAEAVDSYDAIDSDATGYKQ